MGVQVPPCPHRKLFRSKIVVPKEPYLFVSALRQHAVYSHTGLSMPHSLRTLVIESDESMRTMIGKFLEQKGHTVIQFDLPQQSISFIEEDGFDLVILNQGRPDRSDITGAEFSRLLKKIFPNVPIILLWGIIEPTVHAADAVLRKPISPETLSQTVDRLVLRT